MVFQKLATFSYRFSTLIILVWSLFLIFFGYYAPKLSAVLKDHGLLANGAYVKVEHILSSEFHIPEAPVILVFEKEGGHIRQTISIFHSAYFISSAEC